MCNNKSIRAFTLIELLIVITIIGILAGIGAISYVYQIQRSRDASRISDIMELQTAVEQVYHDVGEYPGAITFSSQVGRYASSLPSDPKHGKSCNNEGSEGSETDCAYAYITKEDFNGTDFGEYEISTAFENSKNISDKGSSDGGGSSSGGNTHMSRYEIGVDIADSSTEVPLGDVSIKYGTCLLDGSAPNLAGDMIIINGNSSSGVCSEGAS